MFLYALTLGLLGLVLAAKYLTTLHISKLNARHTAVVALSQRNQEHYKKLHQQRLAAEADEKSLKTQKEVMREHLETLEEELKEQEERNAELTDRIEG